VALLTLAGVGAATAPSAGSTSFSVPGTEAQKAFDLLDERFPGMSADGGTARVVFKAPQGEKMTDAANRATVEDAVKELGASSESPPSPTRTQRGPSPRTAPSPICRSATTFPAWS
jgi:RND superfamily putative drug exporter